LIGGFGFGGVAGNGICTSELETGERAEQEVLYDPGMIEKLLGIRRRRGRSFGRDKPSRECMRDKLCWFREEAPKFVGKGGLEGDDQ